MVDRFRPIPKNPVRFTCSYGFDADFGLLKFVYKKQHVNASFHGQMEAYVNLQQRTTLLMGVFA
jgi:hypothetical protein